MCFKVFGLHCSLGITKLNKVDDDQVIKIMLGNFPDTSTANPISFILRTSVPTRSGLYRTRKFINRKRSACSIANLE